MGKGVGVGVGVGRGVGVEVGEGVGVGSAVDLPQLTTSRSPMPINRRLACFIISCTSGSLIVIWGSQQQMMLYGPIQLYYTILLAETSIGKSMNVE